MSAIVKEVYDAFRSAGVSDAEATAAAQAIPLTGELATKGDINELGAELLSEVKGVRAEFLSEVKGVRAEFLSEIRGVRAEFKSDMKELELRMTVKFYTALALVVAGIKALDFLIG